jgi:hypothetical protein
VDRRCKLTWAVSEQAERLFLRFFNNFLETDPGKQGTINLSEKARAFASKVEGKQISMAALQGYLLEHRNDPLGAERNFDRLDAEGKNSEKKVNEFELLL